MQAQTGIPMHGLQRAQLTGTGLMMFTPSWGRPRIDVPKGATAGVTSPEYALSGGMETQV